jgi:hypothetical protein
MPMHLDATAVQRVPILHPLDMDRRDPVTADWDAVDMEKPRGGRTTARLRRGQRPAHAASAGDRVVQGPGAVRQQADVGADRNEADACRNACARIFR